MLDHIIPIPKKLDRGQGKLCLAKKVCSRVLEWEVYALTAVTSLSRMHFTDFETGEGGLVLEKDGSLPEDSYTLTVENDCATLRASNFQGICYAIATALQLCEYDAASDSFSAEVCRIEDWPDKEYRALMLDLVSSWHPVDKVLRMMDVCFYEKVPYVHLHLIDNAACRFPSKTFPKLATPKYSYSEGDIALICAYARERGLHLIPEVDIPGHAKQLTGIYGEVFGNQLPPDAQVEGTFNETGGEIHVDEVICAGSEACFEGVKALFDEICALFPDSEYIHIGGDEAFIRVWDFCPVCREYMEKNGIADRGELYSDFVARVARHVLSHGRTPIVWEGFPRAGADRIPKETVVIAWESYYNIAPHLLEDGFRIINGSWQPLYIVYNAKRWTKENIMDWSVNEWQHWWAFSKARLNPIHVQDSEKLLGAQISIWGCNYENEVNSAIENLAAMNERCWNLVRTTEEGPYHDRSDFMSRKLLRMIQDR